MKEHILFMPKLFFLVWLQSFLFFITPLFGALIVREIFNILEANNFFTTDIWILIIIFFVNNVLQIFFDVTWVILQNRFFLSNRLLLRKNMMEGLYSQYGALSPAFAAGEAISRFRQDASEAAYFPIAIADLSNFCLFGIIAVFLMLQINVEVTFFVFLPFIFVIIFVNSLRKKVVYYRNEHRKATGEVTSTIREIFTSIQSIQVNTAEENILKHFEGINNKRAIAGINDEFFGGLLRALRTFIVVLATGIMFILIREPMFAGTFHIGDFALFQYLLGWITAFINYIGESIARYHRTKVAYQRMITFMVSDEQNIPRDNIVKRQELFLKEPFPEIVVPQITGSNQLQNISVKNMTYLYPGTSHGIENISFEISTGSLTVITGRVGSGKSTLLKALLGLLPVTEGNIFWNNIQVEHPSKFFIPPYSAYTPQVPSLLSVTVRENLMLGSQVTNQKISEILELAVFEEDVPELENGLDTLVGPKGKKLSGGQQQRLAAARMLFTNAELLVLDDLSSALDVETEELLWKRLFQKNLKKTFLVVSHKKNVLSKADQILVLKNGHLDASGSLKELLKTNLEMQQLWKESSEEA